MGFGEGLGAVIGSSMAAGDLSAGQRGVQDIGGTFSGEVAPYNQFGQSFLPAATTAANKVTSAAGNVMGYEDFMKSYTASPGAEYAIGQAKEAQNESAASKGGLLSGTNQRALSTVGENVANTFANQAYGSYLQGNNQQFGQLQSALGSMFQAIGVGQTATGQLAGVDTAQMGNTASLAKSQAENDQKKGSGIGSMFSGLSSLPFSF